MFFCFLYFGFSEISARNLLRPSTAPQPPSRAALTPARLLYALELTDAHAFPFPPPPNPRMSPQAFISSFGDGHDGPPDSEADSRRVQDFLRTTEGAFRGHTAWRGASEEELEASGEGLEKYLMTKLYPRTFAVMSDDKRVDALLSRRIAALSAFVRPEHLDIPEHFRVEASWLLAQNELVKVNNFKAPRDKLVCILNTCRIINNLLNVSAGNRPPGADDFLPVLIYVVLQANPPQLESNLRYVARFRLESRLVSEAAYFYTNLVSATHFLTTCDHAAFTGLDEDVFTVHMASAGLLAAPEEKTENGGEGGGGNMYDDASSTEGGRRGGVESGTGGTGGGGGGGGGFGGGTVGIAEKMLREGAPAGPSTPHGPASETAGEAAWRRDRERLERELADVRRQLSAATSSTTTAAAATPQQQASRHRRTPLRWRSVEEVEAEGAATLAAEDAAGTLRLPYRFLYARSDDLQVGDVPELLRGYKSLALQYEALARGTNTVLHEVTAADRDGDALETRGSEMNAAAAAAGTGLGTVEAATAGAAVVAPVEETITVVTPLFTSEPTTTTTTTTTTMTTAPVDSSVNASGVDKSSVNEETAAGAVASGGVGVNFATGGATVANDGGGVDLFAGLATSTAPVNPGSESRDPFAQLGLAGMRAGDAGEESLRRPQAEEGSSQSQGVVSDPFADLARVGAGRGDTGAMRKK